MENIVGIGQLLFGSAITAFGVEDLICARLGLNVAGLPWFPGNPLLELVTGMVLLAAGLSIAANVRARLSATLVGMLFLLYVLLLEAARVAAKPLSIGTRTAFFEALAISSSALMLAGTLPGPSVSGRADSALNKLFQFAVYLFALSSIIFGIDHFLILASIASLVPSWMPGHMFWAYLTGAAFIAAGIGIAIHWMDQLAAVLLGAMFLLWFLLLHAPRVAIAVRAHDPNTPDEWSSALIALALCGGSWICASALAPRE